MGITKKVPREKVTFEILHTQATWNVGKAAKSAGVPRLVYVSADGAPEQERRVIKRQNGRLKKLLASQDRSTGAYFVRG